MGKKLNYSFKEACGNVKYKDYKQLNKELMEYLNCSTIQYYYFKRDHFPNIPAHLKAGIEKIFAKYGIPADDVWVITAIGNGNESCKSDKT